MGVQSMYGEKWYIGKRIDAYVAFAFDVRMWGVAFSLTASKWGVDVHTIIGPFNFGFGVNRHYESNPE